MARPTLLPLPLAFFCFLKKKHIICINNRFTWSFCGVCSTIPHTFPIRTGAGLWQTPKPTWPLGREVPTTGKEHTRERAVFSLQKLLQPLSQEQLQEKPLGLCRGFNIHVVSVATGKCHHKAGDNLILQLTKRKKPHGPLSELRAFHTPQPLIPTPTLWRNPSHLCQTAFKRWCDFPELAW